MPRAMIYGVMLLLWGLGAVALETSATLFRQQEELRGTVRMVLTMLPIAVVLLDLLVVRPLPRLGYALLGGLLIGALAAAWGALPVANMLALPGVLRLVVWLGTALSIACFASTLLWRCLCGLGPEADRPAVPEASERPLLLDTSAIIDGRIVEVAATGVIAGPLLVTDFVMNELQSIADSTDKQRRQRGRRGLEVLQRLQSNPQARLQIKSITLADHTDSAVDIKLVQTAKLLHSKIVTNDYNLNQVAQLHGVEVINLNDVANALRPAYLPGESFEVAVIKPGEESGQGVGYLGDGTMVVVIDGRDALQQTVRVVVTSVLQTSGGRMIFTRLSK